MAKVLAFSGSARNGSYNQQLVSNATRGAEATGAEVNLINLADFELPIYNEDLERDAGTPENAKRLKQLFVEHHGLLIASPEYNSSVTAMLKNAIDWISRPAENESPLVAFRGKVAGLMAASPGGLGGLRGLVHLRAILGNIGVIVLPDQMAISRAFEAFDDDGVLKDEKQRSIVEGIGRSVAETAAQLSK